MDLEAPCWCRCDVCEHAARTKQFGVGCSGRHADAALDDIFCPVRPELAMIVWCNVCSREDTRPGVDWQTGSYCQLGVERGPARTVVTSFPVLAALVRQNDLECDQPGVRSMH